MADALGLAAVLLVLLDLLRPALLLLPTITAGGDTPCHYPTAVWFHERLLPDWRLHGWYPGAYLGHPLLLYYFPFPFLVMSALAPLVGMPVAFKPGDKPSKAPPPANVLPAHFQATIYEVQAYSNRLNTIDGKMLAKQATTPDSLLKALSAFGPARVLYRFDQPVNVFSESLTLGSREPVVAGSRVSQRGEAIHTVTYQQVGAIIRLSARIPPKETRRKGPDVNLSAELSVLGHSGVEMVPGMKATFTRNLSLDHTEELTYGQPRVMLAVNVDDVGYKQGRSSYSFYECLPPAGELVKQTATSLSGALSSAGQLVKQTAMSAAGILTPAGTLVKQTATSVTGSVTSAGQLVKQTAINVAGTMTSTGTLVKQTATALTGSISSTGELVKGTANSLAGALTPSGILDPVKTGVATFSIALTGSITPDGVVGKQVNKLLVGALTPVGVLVKLTAKVVSGIVSMGRDLTTIASTNRARRQADA